MMPAFGLAGSSLEMENVTERDPVTVQRGWPESSRIDPSIAADGETGR
jgi:hypothetical protein